MPEIRPATGFGCYTYKGTAEECVAIIDAKDPPNEPPESSDQWHHLIENESSVPNIVLRRTLNRNQMVRVRVEYETTLEWVWVMIDAIREFCRGKTYYTGHSIEYTLLFGEGESVYFDSSHVYAIDTYGGDAEDMEEA